MRGGVRESPAATTPSGVGFLLLLTALLSGKVAFRSGVGRTGYVEDLVGPALFLATDDARYITGTILTVDGGTTASNGQPPLS